MALTKDERRALELARERIRSGLNYYICPALSFVAYAHPELSEGVMRLCSYIKEALGGRRSDGCTPTLEGWRYDNCMPEQLHEKDRADRLAWIDWMLGKPLPGESVKLEWREKSDECEEAEYCGRRFLLTWADWNSRYVVTEPDAGYHVIAELPMNRRDEVDAAIVAHVWPEA
ncbi:hypothetical protein [Herbaspirillum sp. CAH-3]|uniref:hypothetical protein n=1 Tax=Herbaspirillum sp. CAH-3 TaxID=2605746 RepID=UPI00189E06C6|nr:hypothetical protein [Herbaspirillum sp. CAH-3]